MKKSLSVFAFIIVLGALHTEVFAQGKGFYATPYKERNSGSFEKGASILSLGYGIGSINHFTTLWGYKKITFGPLYVKYELGIRDEISVGGYAAMEYSHLRWNGDPYSNGIGLGIGVLGYYHFNKLIPVEKLDVYAGVGFGVKYFNEVYKNSNRVSDSKLYPRPILKVGARYYFSDNFGVYLESGYDYLSSLNLGISLRF